MYLYIYDSFLGHQKYESTLASIERRVTDLGIQGKIARLSVLKNIRELVTDAVKSGVHTIVAIGDDQTFTRMINIVADLDVTLGLIPVEAGSVIARVLGIPIKDQACDVLAARIVRKLDLGKINNYFFINGAEIENANVKLTCDGYSLAPITALNRVRIANVGSAGGSVSNPTDGILEAIITPVESKMFMKKQLQPTVFPFTTILIESDDDVSIVTDNQVVLKTPARVEVAPHKLKVIVGNQRLFE